MAYTSKNPRFDSEFWTDQQATAVTSPPSGAMRFFTRFGQIFRRTSAGEETMISTASTNYVVNPLAYAGAATGLTIAASGFTVTRGTTQATFSASYFIATGNTTINKTVDWTLNTLNVEDNSVSARFSMNVKLSLNAGSLGVYKIGVWNGSAFVTGTDLVLTDGVINQWSAVFTMNTATTYTVRLQCTTAGNALDTILADKISIVPSASAFNNPMTAAGQMIYGGSSGVPTTVAAGTAGQILMSNGTSAPTFLNTMTGAQKWTGRLALQEYVGTNPEVGGSTPFQMVDANKRTQIINPAGTATVKLPTTSILTGEIVEVFNRASNDVTIQSSNGDAVDVIQNGFVRVVALADTPTTGSNWLVLERAERLALSGTSVTGAGTSPSYAITIAAVNNSVTISGRITVGTGSPTSDMSISGLIPTRLRPANFMTNGCNFTSSTAQVWATARSDDGSLELARRNTSLAGVAFGVSTVQGLNVSYVLGA